MDSYGLAQDLLDETYQTVRGIESNAAHLSQVTAGFFAQLP